MIHLSKRGILAACLTLCLPACTGTKPRPQEVVAGEPVVVTKHEYLELPDRLLQAIESPVPLLSIWSEGDLYRAWIHDGQWLATCKGQVDGLRGLVKAQIPDKPRSSDKTP